MRYWCDTTKPFIVHIKLRVLKPFDQCESLRWVLNDWEQFLEEKDSKILIRRIDHNNTSGLEIAEPVWVNKDQFLKNAE